MTFKLSDQLDHIGNPRLPFELYQNYVEENKHRFPESVLKVMRAEKWYPYDTNLASMEITGFPVVGSAKSLEQKPTLKLVLDNTDDIENRYQVELTYIGLFEFEIPKTTANSLIFRYEEVLFFSAYHSHDIKDKMFTHKIEWVGGTVWSITARELEMRCIAP